MIRRLIAISAAITLIFAGSFNARAQNFGMSGGHGGGMGSSGLGSSAFGNGGMGSSGFGGMGGMGSGFGGSGMGGGFGSSGFGNSGFGGGGGNSAFGNSGFGNSGGGYGGGQNFVGRDAGDMQATFGQMGKASMQFMNNMNRSMNRNNNRKSNKQTAHVVAQPMRVEVKVAFTPPRPTSDQMGSVIRTRLARILTDHHMSQPTVTVQGDTVVLSGAAASEDERDVISQLLAIEPGVRNVRNEMTVGQPAGAVNGIAPTPGS
jgi:hypothetical protein